MALSSREVGAKITEVNRFGQEADIAASNKPAPEARCGQNAGLPCAALDGHTEVPIPGLPYAAEAVLTRIHLPPHPDNLHWGSHTESTVWSEEVWDAGQSLPSVSTATKLSGNL